MSTSLGSMEKKIASDVSDNVKKKLKSVRNKAVSAMSSAVYVYNSLLKALSEGNQGLALGDEGLQDLATVLSDLHPSSNLARELRKIQDQALKSNAEGNSLMTELGQGKAKISLCRNQGSAALSNLDSVIKSLGCDVSDSPIPAIASAVASLKASEIAAEKKTASEDDIRRKLEAIRNKAKKAMALAADLVADVRHAAGITTEGLQVGDQGLDELKDVLRDLDPSSGLAQVLREIQNQALECNATAHVVMAGIARCLSCASTCRNIGNAAIANLDSIIAHLPHILEAKPSVLAFSAVALAAKDATVGIAVGEPGVEAAAASAAPSAAPASPSA